MKRTGFSLIETVVVVLIVGVLASVAAPRCHNVALVARDNNVRYSLSLVRSAIELFEARNHRLPGADGNEATFKSDLAPYLREFPVLAAGRQEALNDIVVMDHKTSTVKGEPNPTEGWRYYYNLGVFIVNYKKPMASDPALEYDDL